MDKKPAAVGGSYELECDECWVCQRPIMPGASTCAAHTEVLEHEDERRRQGFMG